MNLWNGDSSLSSFEGKFEISFWIFFQIDEIKSSEIFGMLIILDLSALISVPSKKYLLKRFEWDWDCESLNELSI